MYYTIVDICHLFLLCMSYSFCIYSLFFVYFYGDLR